MRELNRIGVNLNQMARALNSGAVSSPAETQEVVERVGELVAKLLAGGAGRGLPERAWSSSTGTPWRTVTSARPRGWSIGSRVCTSGRPLPSACASGSGAYALPLFLKLINGILLGFEPVRDFSLFSDAMRHSPHFVGKQDVRALQPGCGGRAVLLSGTSADFWGRYFSDYSGSVLN